MLGRVDGQRRPVLLDAPSEFLRGVGAHPELTRVASDDRVDRGERELDTHTQLSRLPAV
jgi:hypothetical protein